MGYASTTDFAKRYDSRVVGKLLSDDGTPVSPITSSTTLASLLDEASGLIEAACLAGERYTTDDLEGLEDNSLETLKGLTCGLAFWLLLQRRGQPIKNYPAVDMQLTLLDQLRNGARVFNVAAVLDAGHGKTEVQTINETLRLNLQRDRNQYFPCRRWPEGA